jgi:hypothetical protein
MNYHVQDCNSNFLSIFHGCGDLIASFQLPGENKLFEITAGWSSIVLKYNKTHRQLNQEAGCLNSRP